MLSTWNRAWYAVKAQHILDSIIVINLVNGGRMWQAGGRKHFKFITEKQYSYLKYQNVPCY